MLKGGSGWSRLIMGHSGKGNPLGGKLNTLQTHVERQSSGSESKPVADSSSKRLPWNQQLGNPGRQQETVGDRGRAVGWDDGQEGNPASGEVKGTMPGLGDQGWDDRQ
ncbi:hypothetical protein E1301_Tti009554 [Triplophysa tibetana]|uniref:Uncharacterized protein n=1 Tax=Triplophysa tibetana TaxID=1572043 RepID=A0A5A9NF38_9TELE|nr:hypothetical protein E1301_Tti009554 [Triplophysa tibetana]